MHKKGAGNDKQGKDAGNRTLCPYRNFSQAIRIWTKVCKTCACIVVHRMAQCNHLIDWNYLRSWPCVSIAITNLFQNQHWQILVQKTYSIQNTYSILRFESSDLKNRGLTFYATHTKVRFKNLCTKFWNRCCYSTMYQIFVIQIAFQSSD